MDIGPGDYRTDLADRSVADGGDRERRYRWDYRGRPPGMDRVPVAGRPLGARATNGVVGFDVGRSDDGDPVRLRIDSRPTVPWFDDVTRHEYDLRLRGRPESSR